MQRREFFAAAAASLSSSAGAQPGGGKIRLAFIGGSHSHALAKAKVAAASGDFELAGIFEPDGRIRAEFEAIGLRPRLLEQILEDRTVTAVAVESDVALHSKHALMALQAGKHVHVEKPPAVEWNEFQKLAGAARAKGLLLQTGYMWRYHPGFQKAIEAARNGWLGEVYQLHGVMNTLLAADRRAEWGCFRGGQMFEQGGYMADAMTRVMGRPLAVTPFLRRDGQPEDDLKDNTVAILEFPKAIGIIRAATLQPNAMQYRAFEIQGSNGNCVLRPIEPPELTIDLAEAAGPYPKGRHRVALPPYERYRGDFANFAAAIRGQGALAVDLEQEGLTQETLLRACGVLKG